MYQGKSCQIRGLGHDHTNTFDVYSPIIYTKTTENADANGVSQTILKAEPRTKAPFLL